jgi:hypothetical protein
VGSALRGAPCRIGIAGARFGGIGIEGARARGALRVRLRSEGAFCPLGVEAKWDTACQVRDG